MSVPSLNTFDLPMDHGNYCRGIPSIVDSSRRERHLIVIAFDN